MLLALLASLIAVAGYVFQDGIHDCNDGNRYTSRKPQPYPFHRRFCGWPKRTLQVASLASLVVLGTMMGSWKGALILLSLPGAWFVATHPTTTDAPCMLLAWASSVLWHHGDYGSAIGASMLAGFIHERGPVFAALYAWHPAPLLGMLAVGWWRKAARPDNDALVGHGFIASLRAHKVYVDWFDMRTHLLHLRGLWAALAWYEMPLRVWATVAVALGSRAIGTDGGRFLFWAAPAVIVALPDVPLWALALHVATFRRCI